MADDGATRSMAPKKEPSLESSVPGCPLSSILLTEELNRRPRRAPEYDKENSALAALVRALAESPGTILQTLADKVVEVLNAGSAGLSLLTNDETRFAGISSSGIIPPTTSSTSSRPSARISSQMRGTMVLCAPERIDMPMAFTSS